MFALLNLIPSFHHVILGVGTPIVLQDKVTSLPLKTSLWSFGWAVNCGGEGSEKNQENTTANRVDEEKRTFLKGF